MITHTELKTTEMITKTELKIIEITTNLAVRTKTDVKPSEMIVMIIIIIIVATKINTMAKPKRRKFPSPYKLPLRS